jgi:hypothetical protein
MQQTAYLHLKNFKTMSELNSKKNYLIIILFSCFFLFSFSSLAQNLINILNDINNLNNLIQEYDINDPRNPNCPCHKQQQKADQEYSQLLLNNIENKSKINLISLRLNVNQFDQAASSPNIEFSHLKISEIQFSTPSVFPKKSKPKMNFSKMYRKIQFKFKLSLKRNFYNNRASVKHSLKPIDCVYFKK